MGTMRQDQISTLLGRWCHRLHTLVEFALAAFDCQPSSIQKGRPKNSHMLWPHSKSWLSMLIKALATTS